MASILRVNTLTDASSNNSIAMSFVAPATAKYIVHYDQANNAVRKSLNNSSVSDDSTGHFTINYSSNFSDALYLLNSGLHENTDDADSDRGGHSIGFENGQTETTSSAKLNYLYGASQGSASTDADTPSSHTLYGDLA
tara:strand:+ start:132 stop:545 length:414 start_codon:yes stop_codon:yes gene_type:complete